MEKKHLGNSHRRRGNTTAAHDLDKVRAALEGIACSFEHLGHSIACTSERVRVPSATAGIGTSRFSGVAMSTCAYVKNKQVQSDKPSH